MTLNIPPPSLPTPPETENEPHFNPLSGAFCSRGFGGGLLIAPVLSCVAMNPTLRALAAAAARGASGGWGWGVSVDIMFCGVMMGTSAERCERIVGKLFAFFVGVVVGSSQALVECLYSSR
jgi:hypothetical protein